jgi:hypothetical protein
MLEQAAQAIDADPRAAPRGQHPAAQFQPSAQPQLELNSVACRGRTHQLDVEGARLGSRQLEQHLTAGVPQRDAHSAIQVPFEHLPQT